MISRIESSPLEAPEVGGEREIVFIPQKVADRLKEYFFELLKSSIDSSYRNPAYQQILMV